MGCALAFVVTIADLEPGSGQLAVVREQVVLVASLLVTLANAYVRSEAAPPKIRGLAEGGAIGVVVVLVWLLVDGVRSADPGYEILLGATVVCSLYPSAVGEHPAYGYLVAYGPAVGVVGVFALESLGGDPQAALSRLGLLLAASPAVLAAGSVGVLAGFVGERL